VPLETVPDTTGGELTIKAAYKNGDDEDKTFYPIETLSAAGLATFLAAATACSTRC
jgi:hypothetical protein